MKSQDHQEQMEEDVQKVLDVARVLKLRGQKIGSDTQITIAAAIEEVAHYLRDSFGTKILTPDEKKAFVDLPWPIKDE